ncbi:MAG: erythromycin esterase family protein [Bacteroidales bacterium]|nr:erythromycin esterase family protein [Bacteroidales bacterium]
MNRIASFLLLLLSIYQTVAFAQSTDLVPGATVEKSILKGETHSYFISLKRDEYAELNVMQKGVDLAIELLDAGGKRLAIIDSPNGSQGNEPVSITATMKGKYELRIYPLPDQIPGSVYTENALPGSVPGTYAIMDLKILSAAGYKQKLDSEAKDKKAFANWISGNANPLKTVDAGNSFEDLQAFRTILKDVRVVGLGEATHGSSEFFRMKHRMLEFLVKELDFTSFYIEASMTRCRYINDYVLYGLGSLDTATTIQGFVTWRVDEVRDMIEWMREYNATVSADKKVKFLGYDLQINDMGWKGLKSFYKLVDPSKLSHLDSLQIQADSASVWSNSMSRSQEGGDLFKKLRPLCLSVLDDMVLNEGQYQYLSGKEKYDENLMNIRLIIQEIESYQNGYNDRRDYYMAQNILSLLNQEKPGAKVVVWAHNMHIARFEGSMGNYLDRVLKQEYYPMGFEFYSGSFQSRDLESGNNTRSWDIITVNEPPKESLPWYFNQTGLDKFYIDFRNIGAEKVKNSTKTYAVHSFGSMYSKNWPDTYPAYLNYFDGMIYIRQSSAAKDFTKVLF